MLRGAGHQFSTDKIMPRNLKNKMRNAIITILINSIPLNIRKFIAIWIGKQNWITQSRRYSWPQKLTKDMKLKNVNEYHKFLWENHLAYAVTYSAKSRYGYENIKKSRKFLFEEVDKVFQKTSINREKDIYSVLEVGCSLGYLLRYMEEYFFPSAKVLMGIDIDEQAISEGINYLKETGSIIELKECDMETLHKELNGKKFDVVFCLGVLMYLQEDNARKVISYMLINTKKLLILSGLANPGFDNQELEKSTIRTSDETFIHNFDEMIKNEGGNIIYRRREGDKLVDKNTIYFVFAKPEST